MTRTASRQNRKKPASVSDSISGFFGHGAMTLGAFRTKIENLIDAHGEDASIDYDLGLGYYDSPECDITITESVARTLAKESSAG